MKKTILRLGTTINKSKLQKIVGGNLNTCIQCYDSCVANSKDRIALGICFDECQANYC
ncbi:hypothetical protein [Tenacibaculum amylolyticum]|uniref:hypothetical protein n=1 Tax=Tenacibaculum amylolyticum TaxID=104269 RepID=UPI003894672F